MDHLIKKEMDDLKADVGEISLSMRVLTDNVKEISSALMGNKFTQDGGLINRVIELEKTVAVQQKEIEQIRTENTKSSIYVNILWAAGGVVCTALIGFIISVLLKHPI